jgi:hypothetical protein
VDDLSVRSARKGEVAHEHVARIESLLAITRTAVALEPARVIAAVSRVVSGVVVSRPG